MPATPLDLASAVPCGRRSPPTILAPTVSVAADSPTTLAPTVSVAADSPTSLAPTVSVGADLRGALRPSHCTGAKRPQVSAASRRRVPTGTVGTRAYVGVVLGLFTLGGCCGSQGSGSGGTTVEQWVPQPETPTPDEATPPPGDLACFGSRIDTEVPEHVTLRAVADLNGDGKLDAVTDSSRLQDGEFTSVVSVFHGDGAGRFSVAESLPVGPMSYSAVVADVDGDGMSDILANDPDGGAIAVFHGAEDGTHAKRSDVSMWGKPGTVGAADLDADEDVDLIVYRYRGLEIWTNDGAGRFGHHTTLDTGRAPETPGVADLDGDGHVDLVVVANDECTFHVFRGRGNARFDQVQTGDSVCPPADVHRGDFNSDGRPDAAWIGHNQGAQIAINSGEGAQLTLTRVDSIKADRIAVHDVTGDQIHDLVVFDELSRDELGSSWGSKTRAHLLQGDGDAGFTLLDTREWDGQYGDPILADVNGDGRLDLVASNWQGRVPGYLVVWLGVGCP